jgi:hypothetical protein
MVHTRVAIKIPVRPDVVWEQIADISSHVQWMADAEEIKFVGERRTGEGTKFICLTKVGPLATKDRMQITKWQPNKLMSVDHRGLFQGSGSFELHPTEGGAATNFVWKEQLTFPWYFGAAVGATLAKPILTAIWRGNLRRLAEMTTEGRSGSAS